MKARDDELYSADALVRELQAHAQTLLDKLNYEESVVADLEEKNKRLTELLNAQMYNQAQSFKDKVLDKLATAGKDRSPSSQP